MVNCIFHRTRADGTELCKTFSTENYCLKQEETGRIYGATVIDVIAGYDDYDKPYSRYTYTETDVKDDTESEA